MKITSYYEYNDAFDPRKNLFMGYYYGKGCVYIDTRIDENQDVKGLGWKAHKDHDLKDVLWYKNLLYNRAERLNPETSRQG